MFLFGQRIRGNVGKHPLAIYCIQLNEAYFQKASIQLRSGHTPSIDKIIYHHIKLAIAIANQYSAYAPTFSLELVSEAIVTLTQSCYKIIEGKSKDQDLSRFITFQIHSALGDYLRKQKKNSIKIQRLSRLRYHGTCINYDINLIEVDELCEKLVKNNLERDVLTLRRLDYKDREVAEKLNIDRNMVFRVRTILKKRYIELCGV